MKEIYLDNSATTRPCAAALEACMHVLSEEWGNPSSLHARGLSAAHVLEEARREVSEALGAHDGRLVFTAGGSEANNLAILGRAYAKERYRRTGARIITTKGEHASVTAPLARLKDEGFDVVEIPTVGGKVDLERFTDALNESTVLVTMMLVNNETGAHYDLKTVASIVHRGAPNAVLHVDATQALFKVPFSARRDGFDMITVSAHKVEGPKGCGALWISPALLKSKGVAPQILGGGQEEGLRSGTENVAAIAAFSAACRYGRENFDAFSARLAALRAHLLTLLASKEELSEVRVNLPHAAAPHILNITLPRIKSETMLHFLSREGFCVSSGSACSSHGRHASPPLVAFGISPQEADCSIRISLSHTNTEEELSLFADALARGLKTLVRIR